LPEPEGPITATEIFDTHVFDFRYGEAMKHRITLIALLWSLCAPLAAQTPVQLTPKEQALMESAYMGKLEEVRRLVLDGTPVDTIDAERRTPLMFAAFNGHAPVAEYLLDAGAEIDAKDSNGRTALMFASSGPFAETVELLLKEGADVNLQGTLEGFTALMTAAGSKSRRRGRRHGSELRPAEGPHRSRRVAREPT